ncbi:MAG: CoA-binding protein [Crocinitomicaceae bacterium]|nr:MAG: CoA-binding protein [Crocinitomicaceae bacterium]
MKPTLVIGATNRPEKYAYKAIQLLRKHGHPVVAFGRMKSEVGDVSIDDRWNPAWHVDTVTLYLNPHNQQEYYEKIIALQPKRVIFNPGTENPEFEKQLDAASISYEIACTLVLLSIGQY